MRTLPIDSALPQRGLRGYLVSQFGNPRGLLGNLVGFAMAVKNRRRAAWAVQQLDARPSEHILEIGFGPGVSIQQLLHQVPGCRVTGVELSACMVAQARRRLARDLAPSRVELRQGTVSSLPDGDGTFHRALAINTLSFWPRPVQDLLEIRRVLVPGGHLLIVMQPRGARHPDAVQRIAARIVAQVSAAGFTQIDTVIEAIRSTPAIAVHARKPRGASKDAKSFC